MDNVVKRPPFIDYQEAFDTFAQWRQEVNECVTKSPNLFKEVFGAIKYMAACENAIAMDVLAYFYKTGVEGLLPENYMNYIKWQFLSAARGNEFAIEKVQFLIGYACDKIIDSDDYEEIAYKNDINENNVLYIIGKNFSKMLVRDLNAYPVEMVKNEDVLAPYSKEEFYNLRKLIDNAVPKTIAFMKS